MAKAKKRKTPEPDQGPDEPWDLSRLPISSEATILAYLSGLQSQLEPIVERHLSATKTGILCEFRGEKKYLNEDVWESPDYDAAELLNAVYAVQKAHRAGDLAQTMALAMLVRELDFVWQVCRACGFDLGFALYEKQFLRPMNCAKGGENSAIFKTDEAKSKLQLAFAKNANKKKGWRKGTVETLANDYGIDVGPQTVSAALKAMGLPPHPRKNASEVNSDCLPR